MREPMYTEFGNVQLQNGDFVVLNHTYSDMSQRKYYSQMPAFYYEGKCYSGHLKRFPDSMGRERVHTKSDFLNKVSHALCILPASMIPEPEWEAIRLNLEFNEIPYMDFVRPNVGTDIDNMSITRYGPSAQDGDYVLVDAFKRHEIFFLARVYQSKRDGCWYLISGRNLNYGNAPICTDRETVEKYVMKPIKPTEFNQSDIRLHTIIRVVSPNEFTDRHQAELDAIALEINVRGFSGLII